MSAAVQRFECTNCGQLDPLAVIALAVALFSLFVAVASFRMQRREHRTFLRRLEAEPQFEFFPRTLPVAGSDGVIRLPNQNESFRLDLGLRNVGDAPATHVLLNLLLPRSVPFWWCSYDQARLPQRHDANPDSTETLNDGERDVLIHWRDRREDRLARHRHYSFYVQLHVDLPADGSVLSVPLQFKVTSDDLAGGMTVFDHTLKVAYARPAGS
jgi:hypothetical protein